MIWTRIPTCNSQLYLAASVYSHHSLLASGQLYSFMFPRQPIEYGTPGPMSSERPFLRLDTLARWIFPEGGVFALLPFCMDPNPSHEMGLLENQAPWEGSDQHWVPGNSWLTSLEIFWDLPSKRLLSDQSHQISEDFRVALLCVLVTRKPLAWSYLVL